MGGDGGDTAGGEWTVSARENIRGQGPVPGGQRIKRGTACREGTDELGGRPLEELKMYWGRLCLVKGRALECLGQAHPPSSLGKEPQNGNLLWQKSEQTKGSWETTSRCDTNTTPCMNYG